MDDCSTAERHKSSCDSTVVTPKKLDTTELVVSGDHGNDLPMFRIAQHRIAVANAIDDVKQAATQIIASNAQDGVVKYLEHAWACKDHMLHAKKGEQHE
ncbi:MAG: HAD hydrolase family protein [bacterium]|nr:HAD hydrolase family protein [bacterium]